MLTLAPHIKIHAQPVSQTGDQITLKCFVVAYYPDGHAEVIKTFYKVVTESIEAAAVSATAVANTVIALPGAVLKQSFEFVKSIFGTGIVSPYVNDLSFVISQPARGPNF